MTTVTTPTTDPFPDRTEAVRMLAAEVDWTVLDIRLASLDARGDTFVTGHVVEVIDTDGIPAQHTVYLDVASDNPGTVTLESLDGDRLAAWLYPADPALPALAPSVYPGTAAVLLERLGIDTTGLSVAVLAYRPGKRAVVRATTTSRTLFLKIVRPDKVDALRERHEAWAAHGIPVPRVAAWAPEGLLALDPLPGIESIGMLEHVADPYALVATISTLSDHIAQVPSTRRARASLVTRLDWYRTRLTQLAPDSSGGITETCDAIARVWSESAPLPERVTIHGDLHLGQLFVTPEQPTTIVGVLDIDTAGLGDPADDAAALVAHLITSADLMDRLGRTGQAARARQTAETFHAEWSRPNDPGFAGRSRAIAATHLLGHALSGSLEAERSLALARAMVLDERPLIPVSPPSHS